MNNTKVAKFQTKKPMVKNHNLQQKTNIADPELAEQVFKATRRPTSSSISTSNQESYAAQ